jgi:RNA polymerase sigma-70 factor (ECF subfamily)
MTESIREAPELLRRAAEGDRAALGELLACHRERLRLMVHLRLDRRLLGRIDASDVLQETYAEAVQRFPEFVNAGRLSFYLWLRFLTAQQLLLHHRRHLGVQARNAGREISLENRPHPLVDSGVLAAQIVSSQTSPSQAAMRAEAHARLQTAFQAMDPMDREVLALRHFEQLGNSEVAEVLGIGEAAASRRYTRALWRLKELLGELGGGSEDRHVP